jgi:hypothetical protein
MDYQADIINNSRYTDYGRAQAAIKELSVTQIGKHSESYEEQIGKYNHKKKIQNGIVTESD